MVERHWEGNPDGSWPLLAVACGGRSRWCSLNAREAGLARPSALVSEGLTQPAPMLTLRIADN